MTTSVTESARKLIGGIFALALVANLLLVTHHWHYGFLIGHEFRQAQTAIITRCIDRQNNFSLRYETPLLGKPWEFPLEFPLYEWAVVGVSRGCGVPHFMAARGVSIACFFLMLPGFALLLRECGMARSRRWLTLALLLTCPVFVFYTRSFLVEAMVLMFSVWFLVAFVRMLRCRRLGWFALCAACGVGAGLVKSLTFVVWAAPAAAFGAWSLWRDFRHGGGWPAAVRTLAWGLGVMVLPTLATGWWMVFTDAIKASHPSAHIFTAKALSGDNYGTFDSTRFQPEVWAILLERWREALMHPALVGTLLAVGAVAAGRRRGWVLGAAACFLFAQLLFPKAYAFQDYYFYACAGFWVMALGFTLEAVLASVWPAWAKWLVVAAPFVAQAEAYHRFYWPQVSVPSHGGTGMTAALRHFTPANSVLVVAGADWDGAIAYYSDRRALMIRNGLENEPTYLERAFADLGDEFVSALILIGETRNRPELVERAVRVFGVDATPTFSHRDADVYLSSTFRSQAIRELQLHGVFQEVTVSPEAAASPEQRQMANVTPAGAAAAFPWVLPAPSRYLFDFGYLTWEVEGQRVLAAHPHSDLWVPVREGRHPVALRFGLLPGAYDQTTDGVDFGVWAEAGDGSRRELFRRWLDPRQQVADRGTLSAEFTVETRGGETLVFGTRCHGTLDFDWAYWAKIEVR